MNLQALLDSIDMDTVLSYGVRTLGALALLAVGWVAAAWISRAVRRGLERAQFDLTLTRFLSKIVRWLILLLVVLACLGQFGVQTTSFAALIGAAALAIGLAFQGTLSNFAAGVMLLVFRPFKVGDRVTVGGVDGNVFEISIFSSIVDTPDNRRFIVPNSQIYGSTIENKTFHDKRRADVAVGVDYAADIDTTREVLLAAAAGVPGRLDEPPPQVVLTGLGASSVDWSVRVWCPTPDYLATLDATLRAVKYGLDEAGIAIPFPQMDVHLDRPGD